MAARMTRRVVLTASVCLVAAGAAAAQAQTVAVDLTQALVTLNGA